MIHLWEVDHPYYCSESNWYSNEARLRFDCWADFVDGFGDSDLDMNHVFRWDWEEDRRCLKIFMMKQRKGLFQPIEIYGMTADDEEQVRVYLTKHWENILLMWYPIKEEK